MQIGRNTVKNIWVTKIDQNLRGGGGSKKSPCGIITTKDVLSSEFPKYQVITLQITLPLKITPPSVPKFFDPKNFLSRKSLIKNFSKDNPPLRFSKKSPKGGGLSVVL
jgi:hypothetical protein